MQGACEWGSLRRGQDPGDGGGRQGIYKHIFLSWYSYPIHFAASMQNNALSLIYAF